MNHNTGTGIGPRAALLQRGLSEQEAVDGTVHLLLAWLDTNDPERGIPGGGVAT